MARIKSDTSAGYEKGMGNEYDWMNRSKVRRKYEQKLPWIKIKWLKYIFSLSKQLATNNLNKQNISKKFNEISLDWFYIEIRNDRESESA